MYLLRTLRVNTGNYSGNKTTINISLQKSNKHICTVKYVKKPDYRTDSRAQFYGVLRIIISDQF